MWPSLWLHIYVICRIASQATLKVRAPLRTATPAHLGACHGGGSRELRLYSLLGAVHYTNFKRKALFLRTALLLLGWTCRERVPKLCIPPLITPIRSGGRVRQRAPSSPVRAPTAADSCRPRSRHVRLRGTPQRSKIAPERSQSTPHTLLVPPVSPRTISEPLQSRGGLAWVRVAKSSLKTTNGGSLPQCEG